MAWIRPPPLQTPRCGGPFGSAGPPNAWNTKICCGFFGNGLHYFEVRQCTGSLLRDLGNQGSWIISIHRPFPSRLVPNFQNVYFQEFPSDLQLAALYDIFFVYDSSFMHETKYLFFSAGLQIFIPYFCACPTSDKPPQPQILTSLNILLPEYHLNLTTVIQFEIQISSFISLTL